MHKFVKHEKATKKTQTKNIYIYINFERKFDFRDLNPRSKYTRGVKARRQRWSKNPMKKKKYNN